MFENNYFKVIFILKEILLIWVSFQRWKHWKEDCSAMSKYLTQKISKLPFLMMCWCSVGLNWRVSQSSEPVEWNVFKYKSCFPSKWKFHNYCYFAQKRKWMNTIVLFFIWKLSCTDQNICEDTLAISINNRLMSGEVI